jgi:hypothetical protein
MDIEEALALQPDRPRWIVIGELVDRIERQEGTENRASAVRRMVHVLSRSAHPIGSNQVGKIVRVYKFLSELSLRDQKYEAKHFAHASIVALEIAHRLYLLDEEDGRKALDQILAGASVAKMHGLYRAAKLKHSRKVSTKSAASLIHQTMVDTCRKIVGEQASLFIGLDTKFLLSAPTKRSETGVLVDFTARITFADGRQDLDGFQVFQLENHKSGWWRARADVVFSATFFRRFWLFLQAEPEFARFIADHLAKLRVSNAGVVLVAKERERFELLSVPTGGPDPDRRDLR